MKTCFTLLCLKSFIQFSFLTIYNQRHFGSGAQLILPTSNHFIDYRRKLFALLPSHLFVLSLSPSSVDYRSFPCILSISFKYLPLFLLISITSYIPPLSSLLQFNCDYFDNCVNNKMLDYDWLLTALIYGLIGCFRSKLSADLMCPITNICNRTGQIGQLSHQ